MVSYFHCFNRLCVARNVANIVDVQTTDNIAQELNGNKLCKACYEDGWRLEDGTIAVHYHKKHFKNKTT